MFYVYHADAPPTNPLRNRIIVNARNKHNDQNGKSSAISESQQL